MKHWLLGLTLPALAVSFALAQSPEARPSLTGHWTASVDYYGSPLYAGFDLNQQDSKLTGKFRGEDVEGSTDGSTFQFSTKGKNGPATRQVKGTVENGALHAEVVETDPSFPDHPVNYTFIAVLHPPRPTASPQRHEFTPTVFYRQFSPFNKPVLTVNPGDTIHTTTVDAGGTDHDGVKRVLGGNPQTGPFYIQSAMPGDTLVVHINRLRLN
ncbi:MAG TPA: acetamidase, partial [Edaphobacter sp.]